MRWPLLSILFALGCAHAAAAPPPAPVVAEPPLPLPRSSIAAVLAHRGDLGLTDGQVERLQMLDDQLDKEQTELRTGFAEKHKEAADAPAPAPANQGRHGGHFTKSAAVGEKPGKQISKLENQLDENDTHAYFAAESAVLFEQQRERARDVAEQYREALYDRRAHGQAQ